MTPKYPAVATLLLLVFSATACGQAAQGAEEDKLLHLADQYRLPQTLHCKAKIVTDYKTIPPGLFHIEGTQEYWVDGAKYRILQLEDSSMYPGMSHDVRWDGDHFQWFNVVDATLMFSTEPRQKTPYIGEPIALLPMEFLNPAGANQGVRLSLDELRSDAVRKRLAATHYLNSDNSKADFPGGAMGDISYSYHLEFCGTPSYLPTAIRRVSSAGVELVTDEIQYQPVQCADGVVYLPRQAKITNRTTDNRIEAISTCTVTFVEADVAVPAETFTLDFQTAKHVINMDKRPHRDDPKGLSAPAQTDESKQPSAAARPSATSDSTGTTDGLAYSPTSSSKQSNAAGMTLLIGSLVTASGGAAVLWFRRLLGGGSR